ncbi:hypothetical protein COLO4_08149 [Corchorus olitorius]|uniref:Uncharacterized protein n=1 Tax=Corchorus olitorius TaxID=93759 RepID=A0A1R3KH38_9ROSI|nr:hypothetical protein COLO4_08149 [Corchorus olitorius]
MATRQLIWEIVRMAKAVFIRLLIITTDQI